MVGQSRFTRRASRRFVLWLGLVPIVLAGCGSGIEEEKDLVPVSGRVTLDGGPWPRPGHITFIPTGVGKPGAATVSYVADFGVDGSFSVRHEGANGLKPGQYWIAVDCPDGEPAMPVPGQQVKDTNAVPAKYRNPEMSGFSFDVSADKPAEAIFDVRTK